MNTKLILIALFVAVVACQKKEIINSDLAPVPIGPYSQGVKYGNTVYVSGQLGMLRSTGKLISNNVTEQAGQALKNIGHILEAAGSSLDKVLDCTVLLTDINDFARVNVVYAQVFKSEFPSRVAYSITALPIGAKVEFKCVAGI
ncbi:2-iminobutanoate/2-iminopropanoate deaminase [Acrasis kona]|uniref:2-iminobutanoate/2-iminopropanoate deaminase n=1 Tax=Acrasis kona TaxID=1008807 RepID=A0AAW2ZS02_9EUKA